MNDVLKALKGKMVKVLLPTGEQEATVLDAADDVATLKLKDGRKVTLAPTAVVLVGPPFQ